MQVWNANVVLVINIRLYFTSINWMFKRSYAEVWVDAFCLKQVANNKH